MPDKRLLALANECRERAEVAGNGFWLRRGRLWRVSWQFIHHEPARGGVCSDPLSSR
jgi:hypothetical protein